MKIVLETTTQWGRLTDGHEKIYSLTQSKSFLEDSKVNNKFVLDSNDWIQSDLDGRVRLKSWSKSDGSGICPKSFIVATEEDLNKEIFAGMNTLDKMTSGFLKLPLTGYRDNTNGKLNFKNNFIYLSLGSSTDFGSKVFHSDNYIYKTYSRSRTFGYPVRCIKMGG